MNIWPSQFLLKALNKDFLFMSKTFFIKLLLSVSSLYSSLLLAEQTSLLDSNPNIDTTANSQEIKNKEELFPNPFLNKTNKPIKKEELYAFLKGEFPIDTPSKASHLLEIGLEYPINFGVHLRYIISKNVYSRLGLSFMPRFFLNSFEKLSSSLGYLNAEEAKLISKTFENSMYVDFRLAWAPHLQNPSIMGGPYLELGLSGMFFGNGKLEGAQLKKVITDERFEELQKYSIKTNAFNATVHAGYQIPFEKIKLNFEVGLIKILDTHILSVTTVDAPNLLSANQKQKFKRFLRKKGWIFPTVSAWISFSF